MSDWMFQFSKSGLGSCMTACVSGSVRRSTVYASQRLSTGEGEAPHLLRPSSKLLEMSCGLDDDQMPRVYASAYWGRMRRAGAEIA